MKTKHYCFAIFLLMAISHLCFAQAYTLTVKNEEKKDENLHLYNLFYLSKAIAKENINDKEKANIYYSINSLIPNTNISVSSPKVHGFISGLKEHHKNRFKNSINENPNLAQQRFPKGYLIDKDLTDNFREIKEGLCLQTFKKNIDTLKNSYNNYKSVNTNFNCQAKKFDMHAKIFLNKERLLQKLKESLTNKVIDSTIYNENITKIGNLKTYSEKDYIKIKENFKDLKIDLDKYADVSIDKDSLKDKIENEIKALTQKYLSLDNKIDLFAEKLVDLYFSENKIYDLFKNTDIKTSSTVVSPQQIIINSQIQTAQAQTGASGISIPSQSQMIEAMAIFLAKRAKQEAAIWFMDQIRLKMNNPMLLDVFPETIKVIDGVENYKVPTFNTTWKYAIAKDFVEMPRNLVNSPWVKEVLIKDTKNHAMLKQSVDFGYDMNRLMTEQYNYRDIIKYFYINQRIEKDSKGNEIPNQEINRLIDNSTTLLYIVINEFFAIENIDGKDVYRLLSYEEIAGLNKDEIEVLLELIDLKYKERINNVDLIKNLNLTKKEEINKWIGNILISLSQLDKIRNDYQTKKEEIKNDIASKNFYNVWNVLNQMTKNLYNESLFDSPKMANLKTKIEWVQKGMSVYEHFQNNDYVGVANQTFELVNLITLNSADATITGNLHFEYAFGDNKKVSLNSITENEFVIKTYNGPVENDINVSFANNNLVVKKGKEINITIENYLILAKYIVSSTSKKRIKDFYNRETFENFEKILKLSKDLNIDETEMLQLINSIYMAKIASSINQNMAQVLISRGFTIKDKKDNTFKTSNNKYTKQLTNLLSFFGDVITVKDEHQLAGIIDSYALPPTSYKLKRKQPSSIDLNAYVGAFGGGLMSLKSTTIDSQPVYGITAPIGIAFTWSRNGWYDNYGFTVDVVDLGNVVNHYLVKPGEDYAKDVHFSEVFSLGTTFLMGIKNSPFVISGGFRFQPYNTGKDANNKVFDAGIFHLGVKIDIPLIHLSGKDF